MAARPGARAHDKLRFENHAELLPLQQAWTNAFIALKLGEKARIEHLSKLSHPFEPHLVLLEQLLQGWEPLLVLLEPCSDFIDCFHAFTGLEDEVMLGNSKDHLVNALVQIEQFRVLLP